MTNNNKAVKRKSTVISSKKQNIIAEYSGPLPLPQDLEGYENIKAGFAERIVSMAESESSNRHNAQQRQITTERIFVMGGQMVIIVVMLVVAGILGYALYLGYDGAVKWIGVSLSAVGSVFLIMRKR